MKSVAFRVFSLWLALMLAGGWVVSNSRFSADITFFLPTEPTPKQQVLLSQFNDGVVSRLLMLSIAGGSVEQRAEVSSALRENLVDDPAFVSIQNGQFGDLTNEIERLLQYRYVLSPTINANRFTEEGLRSAIEEMVNVSSSPMGYLIKPYFSRDPTGEVLELVEGLNPVAQPQTAFGTWISQDGDRSLLLLQTSALGSDTDGQERAIQRVNTAFDEVVQDLKLKNLTLTLSGPGQFAVQARESIKSETARLFLISFFGIAILLLWIYRSPRLLALGLLPMISGAMAGVVMVSWVDGTVFGITLGFGTALMGEAVDYAIYYFVQSGQQGLAQWRERFWPTVRLGVLTSVLGFGALLFSGFPGLSQLGLYAVTGVVTAAGVTRFVLPVLAGENLQVPPPGLWVNRLQKLLDLAHRLRLAAVVLSLLACAFVWHQRDRLGSVNLGALSSVTIEQAQIDARMRADLAAPDARYLISIQSETQESALQLSEWVGTQLDPMVASGILGGYDSPARFLPSQQLQAQRLAALPEESLLRDRLSLALRGSGLSLMALEPFVSDVQSAHAAGYLERGALSGSPLGLAVDAMLMPAQHGGWNVVMPLRPAPGIQDGQLPLEQLKKALEGSGAELVDLKSEFDYLYIGYMGEAVHLTLLGLLAIGLLLAVVMRSVVRFGRVLLTLFMTLVVLVALLQIQGQSLHLLHLVGLMLTVAVGSNYALFFDRAAQGKGLDAHTLLSLSVATLTTMIGFGVMAFSDVPVLKAIGITVGPGVLLALLFAAVMVYPRAEVKV